MKKIIIIIWLFIIIIWLWFMFYFLNNWNMNDLKTLIISSYDFENNKPIPKEYTCDWNNSFPNLEINWLSNWEKSLAIIVDDPDAPWKTWIHLIAYNIAVNSSKIIINEESLNKSTFWINSSKEKSWWWPCPPIWHATHHYFFKIYWLNKILNLENWLNKEELLKTIKNYTISYWEIIWTYFRN